MRKNNMNNALVNDPMSVLENLMRSRGIKTRQLAKISGVHYNTIYQWKSRGGSPNLEKFMKCLNALNYDLELTEK